MTETSNTRLAILGLMAVVACNRPSSGVQGEGIEALPAEKENEPGPAGKEAPVAPSTTGLDEGKDGPVRAITDEERSVFWGSGEEPEPTKRFDDQHYVTSNEQHHELYFPYVERLGGGYIGVASDQNYTIAAHARSEWVWLMDYDIVVVRLHDVIRALVLATEDAAAYQALWTAEGSENALLAIRETHAKNPDLERIEEVYDEYRSMIEGYNRRVSARAKKGKCAFWLTDPGSYEYIRALFQAGRIRSLRGNLLDVVTLAGIGAAAVELGTKIRIVYFSDAESFFPYKDTFKNNIASLPMDDRSVILRTVSGAVYKMPPGDYQWHYNVQSGLDFSKMLAADPPVPKVYAVVKKARLTGVKGVSVLGVEPRPAWSLGAGAASQAKEPASSAHEQDEVGQERPSLVKAAMEDGSCGTLPEEMVCVPAGDFWRGADDSDPDRKPYSKLWVSSFLIDVFEVTNEKFNACIKAGACEKHEHYKGFMAPRQPAVGITWTNAHAYCAWAGKRLPTEAEWEKASRGPDGDLYPWGNAPPTCQLAHYRGCGETTLPVGSLPAGHYGIHDMAGNGYEWVQDWWSPCYDGCEGACGEACTGKDPRGPCGGEGDSCKGYRPLKVLKGGSWFWPASQIIASWRRHYKKDSGEHRLSVRCAMTPPG